MEQMMNLNPGLYHCVQKLLHTDKVFKQTTSQEQEQQQQQEGEIEDQPLHIMDLDTENGAPLSQEEQIDEVAEGAVYQFV